MSIEADFFGVTDDDLHFDEEGESKALSASPIACAVADAWLRQGGLRALLQCTHPSYDCDELFASLDALEAATRESPLRKVRP